MKNLIIESPVFLTHTEHRLVEHSKAILDLHPGCAWAYVIQDGRQRGVVFAGPNRLAVDAITETEVGAMGQSVGTELQSISIYLGDHTLEDVSAEASTSALANLEYQSAEDFIRQAENMLKDKFHVRHEKEVNIDRGNVLLAEDSDGKDIVLVKDRRSLVFVHGEGVYVLSNDNHVSVGKSGVRIGGKRGRTLTITKDGIHGLGCFENIGPAISAALAGSMGSLRKLKHIQPVSSVKPNPYAWDNVDDFDWDD